MRINEIINTCSMVELGCLSSEEVGLSKEEFNKELRKCIVDVKEDIRRVKCIIYNTNFNWSRRFSLYLVHGFKTIGSYRGFNNRKVYIMQKKINYNV